MEGQVKIGKYVALYGGVHFVILLGAELFFAFFEIESNSGMSVGAIIGSAMFVSIKFIKDNKRPPNKEEKYNLVLMSLLASWVVSFLLLGVFALVFGQVAQIIDFIKSINIFVLLGIFLFVCVLYFLVLLLSYGYLARKQYEGMAKKGNI